MNNFDFKKIIAPLATIHLSEQEKGSLRLRVLDYMRSNPAPVKSGFAMVKYFSTASLSLVIILGFGSLITSASQQSLPGQLLYPVKRATEQVAVKTIISPEGKINYSLSLIEKRYSETNQLLAQQSLNDQTESAITTDIQTHIADIQNQTETIAQTNPAEALSYNTKLAQALKTNTQVFLAVSEKNQSIKKQPIAPKDHTKIVLAAYENTAKISLKTEQLQQVILSDTDIITIKTAEKKYHDILPKIIEVLADESITPTLSINIPELAKETVAEITRKQNDVVIVPEQNDSTPQKTEIVAPIQKINTPEPETVATLAKKLDDAYITKKYNRVIVLADQIDQMISDTKKIKAAEQKYDVVVPTVIEPDTATINSNQEVVPLSTETKKIIDISIIVPLKK